LSIKARLRVSFAVLTVLAVSIVVTLVVTARQIKSATEDTIIADRIVRAAGELNLLARSVARQSEESTQAQWWDRYNSLTKLISQASLRGRKQKERVNRLAATGAGLGTLFNRILIYREGAAESSGPRGELYAESEERLTAQLLTKTQSMVYEGGLIVQETDKRILTMQSRAFQIVLSLVVMLIGNVLITFHHLYGATARSLETLEEGAERIAGGDLDSRVAVKGPSEIVRLATAFNDMAEKLRGSYRSLLASERRYKDLTEFLPQTTFETDRSARLTFMNMEGLRVFGCMKEDLSGSIDLTRLVAESDRVAVRQAMERSMRERRTTRIESTAERKDGGIFPACAYFAPVLEGEEIKGIRGILIDMTEQKRVEQQLQQSQKMEAIGTLSGGIAHDFNNILAAIIGFGELALDDVGDRPERHFLENILKAGSRGKNLVRQILAFSRRQEHPHEPIAIGPVMEETINLLRASIPTTIEIRHSFPSETLIVRSDPVKIQQVVMNLSMNAAYAMREKGGTLEIGMSVEYRDHEPAAFQTKGAMAADARPVDHALGPGIPASAGRAAAPPLPSLPGKPDEAAEPYVRISVRDTGAGMSQSTIQRIFDPFFTTKQTGEGTGLGLSVVHGIVKDHGGAIEVDSELGKGSAFHIFLPLISALKEKSASGKG
jgi:PAS domain S-box-containing protein